VAYPAMFHADEAPYLNEVKRLLELPAALIV
jgi:hypothetical protein